jgi:hypothetical protein
MSDIKTILSKIWLISNYNNWVASGTPENKIVEQLWLQKKNNSTPGIQLVDRFDMLPNVNYINLSGNRGITRIPPSIENLENLKLLDLTDTGIETIEKDEIINMKNRGISIIIKGTPLYKKLYETNKMERKIDKETTATNIIDAEDIKITDLLQSANYKIFIVKNNYYSVDISLLNNIKRKIFRCDQNNSYNSYNSDSDIDSDSDSDENYAKKNELFALQNIVPFNGYVFMDDFKKAIASMDNKYFELEETSKKINSIKKETGECIELKDSLSLYSITPILVSISESSMPGSSNMPGSKRQRYNELGGGKRRTRRTRRTRKSRRSRRTRKSRKSKTR